MTNTKTFQIKEMTFGKKDQVDQIIFLSVTDLHEAHRDIDNGNDILVAEPGDIITLLPNRLITSKVYDGTIQLKAQSQPQ
jgi:hypothetical protein